MDPQLIIYLSLSIIAIIMIVIYFITNNKSKHLKHSSR